MDSLAGKTIRWVFDDGPLAGVTFDHSFDGDGSVTWRMVDGQHQGATAREKSYGAVKVNESVWAVSYLAASGHTLTVILDFDEGRVYSFASNATSWESSHGRFTLMQEPTAAPHAGTAR